jgi:hypothetical protein
MILTEHHIRQHTIPLEENRVRGSIMISETRTTILQESVSVLKYGTSTKAYLKYGPGPADYIIFKRTT